MEKRTDRQINSQTYRQTPLAWVYNDCCRIDAGVIKLVICLIAISCNMGKIINPVCLCSCVRLRAFPRSNFLANFYQNWHGCKKPQTLKRVRLHHPFSILPLNPFILDEEVLKIHANINNNSITAVNVRESPKFSRPTRHRGRGTR